MKKINKYFTCKKHFDHYEPNVSLKAIRIDEGCSFIGEPDEVTKTTHRFMIGEIADRLYDYEQLGYTPEELERIIVMYKMYKSQSYTTYGALGSVSNDQRYFLDKLIDGILKSGDKNVSIFFGPSGTSIHVTSDSPEDEEESPRGKFE